MKRSSKVTIIIIVFFLVIAGVIVARTMIGAHFAKKFGKRPPPGIIVTEVVQKEFSEKIALIDSPFFICGAKVSGIFMSE